VYDRLVDEEIPGLNGPFLLAPLNSDRTQWGAFLVGCYYPGLRKLNVLTKMFASFSKHRLVTNSLSSDTAAMTCVMLSSLHIGTCVGTFTCKC